MRNNSSFPPRFYSDISQILQFHSSRSRTMAEGGGYHRAGGVKVVGIPARRIDLDENTNFVFMDLKWTSRKWDQELIFISALCEGKQPSVYKMRSQSELWSAS